MFRSYCISDLKCLFCWLEILGHFCAANNAIFYTWLISLQQHTPGWFWVSSDVFYVYFPKFFFFLGFEFSTYAVSHATKVNSSRHENNSSFLNVGRFVDFFHCSECVHRTTDSHVRAWKFCTGLISLQQNPPGAFLGLFKLFWLYLGVSGLWDFNIRGIPCYKSE